MMTQDDIRHCLSKQLPNATSILTDYGEILLDNEMKEAVKRALEPILKSRLQEHKN